MTGTHCFPSRQLELYYIYTLSAPKSQESNLNGSHSLSLSIAMKSAHRVRVSSTCSRLFNRDKKHFGTTEYWREWKAFIIVKFIWYMIYPILYTLKLRLRYLNLKNNKLIFGNETVCRREYSPCVSFRATGLDLIASWSSETSCICKHHWQDRVVALLLLQFSDEPCETTISVNYYFTPNVKYKFAPKTMSQVHHSIK